MTVQKLIDELNYFPMDAVVKIESVDDYNTNSLELIYKEIDDVSLLCSHGDEDVLLS